MCFTGLSPAQHPREGGGHGQDTDFMGEKAGVEVTQSKAHGAGRPG